MDDERRNWFVNTQVLYNFISCTRLPQQPLSVDFLPDPSWGREPAGDVVFKYLACGLHLEPDDRTSVYILEVALPAAPIKGDLRRYCQCEGYEGFPLPGHKEPMYQRVAKAENLGDINRVVSHAYAGKSLLAAKTKTVFVFDLEHGAKAEHEHELKPVAKFSDHEKDGYGLAFHKTTPLLGSCSDDGIVNIWDVNAKRLTYNFQYHTGLNCLEFLEEDNITVAAAEDGHVVVLDSRQPELAGKTKKVQGAVNAVTRHFLNPDIFATGATNGAVHVWDYRKLEEPVHQLLAHKESVVRVHFNKRCPTLLASASEDMAVCVFDLEKPKHDFEHGGRPRGGDVVEEEEGEPDDAPDELIFTHLGHQEQLYDFCWGEDGPTETFVASVSEDFKLQVWQMAEEILNYAEDTDEAE